MNKAIIFDFDGTIAETIPLSLEAIESAYEINRLQVPSKQTMISHFGANEFGMLKQMSPADAEKLFSSYISEYARMHKKYAPKPFDGIVDAIAKIKKCGFNVDLVTGKHEIAAKISLNFYGIEKLFDEIRYGGDEGTIKTANIRQLLEIWNASPENSWYLGDVLQDIIDAKNAGIHPLTARWAQSEVSKTEQIKEAKPEAIFTSVAEFDKWINNFL